VRTLRLFILIGLIGGLFFIYRSHFFKIIPVPETRSEIPAAISQGKAEPPELLLRSREEMDSLVLARKDLRIEIKKKGDGWQLVAPVTGTVSGSFAKELFQRLHEVILEDSFTVKEKDLPRYGLMAPSYVLEFTKTGDPKKFLLQIGDTTPDGKSAYARWKGETRIYLIQNQVRDILNTPLEAVRTQRVFSSEPRPLSGFEIRWKGQGLRAVKSRDQWRLDTETGAALDGVRTEQFLDSFWNLRIERYAAANEFPDPSREDFVRIERGERTPWTLWIGTLDEGRDAYPVSFPEEGLEVWVARKDLEPFLRATSETLQSRHFLDFSTRQISRVQVQVNDRKISFISKDGIWYSANPTSSGKVFEGLETLLNGLPGMEYLKTLNRDEKSALLFDPSEVGLTLLFFREGTTEPFMELKFYVRDYAYLEINSSPPLYVLPQEVLVPFFRFLQPFLK